MAANKILITAGVITLLQSIGQMIYSSLALIQYFCIVDFLREIPMLIYVKIMYFHNPGPCGIRINIGQAIDGIANQAFVLINNEPLTVYRTFLINSVNLGLSVFWIIGSLIVIMGGAKNTAAKSVRWPWALATVAAIGADIVAVVIYIDDSFYTRTLADMMEHIGGVVTGLAGSNLDTSWVAWVMVILYSRFVVLFLVNVLLLTIVIVDCNAPIRPITTGTQVESPATNDACTSDKESDVFSTTSETRLFAKLPRPSLSRSFRRMKEFLFNRPAMPVLRSTSNAESNKTTPERSLRAQPPEPDKKRTVNFPENLLSLPQRLENLIAEQQRRLDHAVIDTAGRNSPPRASQSMPQLSSEDHRDARGRRGTAAELQGQLPWAYVPSSAHRMRDQLPPDEDLPPVPLPDYTAIQPFRKASVHRAASSLSSLLHKRDAFAQSRPTITESDVLY
ncbi:unnamed protein product [Chilo suppressalis]|uniref:Uncharacterized protein n=1 Tax=Chilo suppressalis TaxID=168631 RepID=A0ABN8AZT0_CHISP|nr:hypothetical protein evm_013027 [Chilo suppressalis]CAH0402019.1 unnamed protein product [Chilo suppressalis]